MADFRIYTGFAPIIAAKRLVLLKPVAGSTPGNGGGHSEAACYQKESFNKPSNQTRLIFSALMLLP